MLGSKGRLQFPLPLRFAASGRQANPLVGRVRPQRLDDLVDGLAHAAPVHLRHLGAVAVEEALHLQERLEYATLDASHTTLLGTGHGRLKGPTARVPVASVRYGVSLMPFRRPATITHIPA